MYYDDGPSEDDEPVSKKKSKKGRAKEKDADGRGRGRPSTEKLTPNPPILTKQMKWVWDKVSLFN